MFYCYIWVSIWLFKFLNVIKFINLVTHHNFLGISLNYFIHMSKAYMSSYTFE